VIDILCPAASAAVIRLLNPVIALALSVAPRDVTRSLGTKFSGWMQCFLFTIASSALGLLCVALVLQLAASIAVFVLSVWRAARRAASLAAASSAAFFSAAALSAAIFFAAASALRTMIFFIRFGCFLGSFSLCRRNFSCFDVMIPIGEPRRSDESNADNDKTEAVASNEVFQTLGSIFSHTYYYTSLASRLWFS